MVNIEPIGSILATKVSLDLSLDLVKKAEKVFKPKDTKMSKDFQTKLH